MFLPSRKESKVLSQIDSIKKEKFNSGKQKWQFVEKILPRFYTEVDQKIRDCEMKTMKVNLGFYYYELM